MAAFKFYTILLVLLFIIFPLNQTISQTITSTAAGGRWGVASTWVGGVVPSTSSDVIIAGPVKFQNGDGSCRNLTVNSGASLTNQTGYAYPEQILTVTGNVTNNGTIRSDGNLFVMKIQGNITNNGTWTFKRTELIGSGTQTLSSTNKSKFENYFLVSSANKPALAAGSELIFTSTVDLGKSTLDMKNFSLTLISDAANITNGKVNNTALLIGTPTFDIYKNSFYPVINDITYEGNITVKGLLKINSNVTMIGSITISDTLENSTGYAHPEKKLTINGNLTNNGIITNLPGSAGFALNVSGNIINNGIWTHNRTELSGEVNQTISQSAGKKFESSFKVTDLTGQIIAGSALNFARSFDLNKCAFDLKTYTLTLTGESANIYNGVVFNTKDIVGAFIKDIYGNRFYPIIENVIYDGNINLKGILRFNWTVTLRGDVTVVDTIQNSTGYAHPEKVLKIIGNFINNGLPRDGGSNGFVLDITGNITANSKIANKRVQLAGSGARNINDLKSAVFYYCTGEKVTLEGNNYLPNLTIDSKSKCILSTNSRIFIPNDYIDENLDNWSEIVITRKFSTALDYSFFKSSVKVVANSGVDSVKIQSFGHQVPKTYAGAVKNWWRVTSFGKNSKPSFSSITFKYNDELLGNNNEAALQVYHSEDGGITWKQISTSTNLSRDLNNNFVTITDGFGFGDYLLSSVPDPASVSPSIICSIIGTSNIRIGAPTRLKVQYVNNSDAVAEDCLITVNTGTKVHIKSIEVPMATGGFLSLPKDSLFFENEDTTLVLYALQMAPREERTFDIIVIGDPPTLNKSRLFFDPVSLTVGAAVTWVAWKGGTWVVCKGIDYLGDKAIKNLKLTQQEQQNYDHYVKGGIPTELAQRKGGLRTFGEKQVAVQLTKKLIALNPAGESAINITYTVNENVRVIAPTLRQRIFNWFYKETGLYGVETTDNGNQYQPTVSTVTQKKGNLVTSWDPNEKVGPSGFGDKQFITSAGTMTYQILFENKKEATAPAYKIVIVDTLNSEFDPESVEFGKTSHEGDQYNWVITRNNNILKWEIEGIELPPNKVPPEGEGWVTFSVKAKSNLQSGTEIKNKATITFDLNKPITTNEYVNKLDFNPPTTSMTKITKAKNDNQLIVKWQSNDGTGGSGIESSTIFMSVDNGSYDLAGVSNSDSLVVNMLSGTHIYSFYAIAKDYVGNIEINKPNAISNTFINSINVSDNEIPSSFTLGQNYPNPFNPETTIKFSIPQKSRVILEVYNLLGQRVTQLVDKELSPANYEVIFDGSKLASGVYFYKLYTNNFNMSKKMILIK